MKKSTNEPNSPTPSPQKPPEPPVLWQMFKMEGGFSILIIFPLILIYFLKLSIN